MQKYFIKPFIPNISIDQWKHDTICVVSNKLDMKRNYSKFIDSCDFVVRSGKACNINTGLTGSKLDCMVLSIPKRYWEFSEERRHIKEIKERAKLILFLGGYIKYQDMFYTKYNLKQPFGQIPGLPLKDYSHYTSTIATVCYFRAICPFSKIYFFGDLTSDVRTKDSYTPNHKGEDDYIIQDLIDRKLVTHILEEDKTEDFKFSEPV